MIRVGRMIKLRTLRSSMFVFVTSNKDRSKLHPNDGIYWKVII